MVDDDNDDDDRCYHAVMRFLTVELLVIYSHPYCVFVVIASELAELEKGIREEVDNKFFFWIGKRRQLRKNSQVFGSYKAP